MTRRARLILVLVLIAVAGLVVLGSVRGNRVTGHAGGRTIVAETAHALSMARLEITGPVATVTVGELQARVTPERVELPDGAVPPSCMQVELRESDGRIRVELDGVEAD